VADFRRSGRGGPPQPGRVALLALTAAGLLALVAMGAARGALGSGAGRPAFPADLVASLLLLLLVGAVAAVVLALVVLVPDQRMRSPRSRRISSLSVLLPLAFLLAVWLFREPLGLLGELGQGAATASTPPIPDAAEPAVTPTRPGPLPLLVAGAAVAAMITIVAAGVLADRRRRGPPRTPAERLVELLDDTLDDIEREPDPRRAVIAAWARMERGLAAAGLPRRAAEAPFEYAGRVLAAAAEPPGPVPRVDQGGGEAGGPSPRGRGVPRTPPGRPGHPLGVPRTPPGRPGHPLGVPRTPPVRPASVHRLTDLFERAKFSRHTIDLAMRDEAVAALRAVRADLAEAVRAAERAGADAAGEPAGR
jgi:Domain of unknown function (DUF4129)